ncbi:MAG: DNA repair protein RadC [Bacteroidaceae bacterium]|nr:DNA repair protein RadC [Bacteroidaceae bacterium]
MTDQPHITIKDLDASDRPRERLMAHGASALSTAELLAILIGGGTTEKTAVELMQEIMDSCDNRLVNLSRLTLSDLTSYKGIGEARALSIIAAAEIGRRRSEENMSDVRQFADAQTVYQYFRPKIQDLTHEQSWALLLNNNSRLIRCVLLSTGGLTETTVDPRLLFREACQANATCFILVHNHPSGSTRPSRFDNELTERLHRAAQTMCIHLIDHIIVTDGDYYSYAESGKL